MPLIMKVTNASAHLLPLPGGDRGLEIAALGEVNTTGWSHPRLSPWFYVVPPSDGIWDFNFIADPPSGIVAPVIMPIAAIWAGRAPGWCVGVRIHAAQNVIEVAKALLAEIVQAAPARYQAARADRAIVQQTLASYDDSHQPTGTIHWHNDGPWGLPTPHVEMKKLHHDLLLTVEGPDEAHIRHCIQQAIAAGAVAAIIAAITTGGGALTAAIGAFLSTLQSCLGEGFSARVDDQSHWIYWDT